MKRILFALAALTLAGSAHADAALFQQKCAACHGKDGTPTAAGAKMGAPDLKKVKEPEEKLVAEITNGKNKMPAYKAKLTKEQIDALAKFVKNGLK